MPKILEIVNTIKDRRKGLTVGIYDGICKKLDDEWLLEQVEKLHAENSLLKGKLEAKLVLINNGWEEERYALQDKIECYEKAFLAMLSISHEDELDVIENIITDTLFGHGLNKYHEKHVVRGRKLLNQLLLES